MKNGEWESGEQEERVRNSWGMEKGRVVNGER